MNMLTLIAIRNMLIRSQCFSSWVMGRSALCWSFIIASPEWVRGTAWPDGFPGPGSPRVFAG